MSKIYYYFNFIKNATRWKISSLTINRSHDLNIFNGTPFYSNRRSLYWWKVKLKKFMLNVFLQIDLYRASQLESDCSRSARSFLESKIIFNATCRFGRGYSRVKIKRDVSRFTKAFQAAKTNEKKRLLVCSQLFEGQNF